MAAVVSDTSVIHYLAVIGHTELLRIQFERVLIPPAVWRELTAKPALPGFVAAQAGVAAGWLTVRKPAAAQTVIPLCEDLDPGEAEAITLACECKPATVLMDEREGRGVARRLGLKTLGTVGILANARQSGTLRRIRPLLEQLMRQHRFRLSREIYDQLVAGDERD